MHTVPGYQGIIKDEDEAVKIAKEVGGLYVYIHDILIIDVYLNLKKKNTLSI